MGGSAAPARPAGANLTDNANAADPNDAVDDPSTTNPNGTVVPPSPTNPNDGNAATNPNALGPAEVGTAGDGNFVVGTSFVDDPNLTNLAAGVPAGTWTTFYLPGDNSAYYTGNAEGLKQTVKINRQVQVFVPAQYVNGTPAPLLVLMDGGDFQYTLKNTLPNLIAKKSLPPLVAVTVSAGSAAGTYNERSYEYDVVSTRWSDYLENEVLPQVESRLGVKLTANPALRGTLGGSSGGACALTMGWLTPNRYTRLVTFSGSFVNLWPTADYKTGAWTYADGGVAGGEKKNLRISLSAGQNDLNAGSGGDTDWLLANQKVYDALRLKNYHCRYTYVKGGNHEEAGALRQQIPTELAWAWRGWEEAIP